MKLNEFTVKHTATCIQYYNLYLLIQILNGLLLDASHINIINVQGWTFKLYLLVHNIVYYRYSVGFSEAWQPAVYSTSQYVTLTFPDIYVVRAIVTKGKPLLRCLFYQNNIEVCLRYR